MNKQPISYSPEIKRNTGISPLWILPIITVLLAAWFITKAIHDSGERIQIYFSNAQGLIAGRTTIRYQGLEVGIIKAIKLAPELDRIYVDAEIYPEATTLLSSSTRFWLVKPTASLSGVSGLDALVSGNYIAIHPGNTESKPIEHPKVFAADDNAPSDLIANGGLIISLLADDLGGLSIGSQIMYKKIPIGEVFRYQLDQQTQLVLIQASIKEAYRHLITSKSRFWNVSGLGAHLGVHGIDIQLESLSTLVGGAIAVDSSEGGKQVAQHHQFKLYKDLKAAGLGIPITIHLPDNSGINPSGTSIMYKGIEIGQVVRLQLSDDHTHVIAHAAIQPSFSQMLTRGSRFILQEANVSISGIENLPNLVKGNYLTLIPGQGDHTRHFTALRAKDDAKRYSQQLEITLLSESTYGLNEGSPLLYRNLTVGKVERFILTPNGIEIVINIDDQYRHLIDDNTVFWNQSGVTIDASLVGIHIQTAPLPSLLQGGIAFDNLPGIENKHGQFWKLYESYQRAQKFGESITLIAATNPGISQGTPIKYRGVKIGEVMAVSPSFTDKRVTISARVQPKYASFITRTNTAFWVAEVKVGFNGITNLDSLLVKTIEVQPGSGNKRHTFTLATRPYHPEGIQFTLQSEEKGSVSIDTPVSYRGMEVGKVIDIQLGSLADRVISTIEIAPQYAYLVRKNTVFWNTSGMDVSIGLSGANIKSGTFDSLVRGGIAFATPDHQTLFEPAPRGHTFYLHPHAQKDWKKWKTAIPKP